MPKILIFACFALCYLWANTASVTMLNPQVEASLNGSTKELALKDEVSMGATIKSAQSGKAQLMLADSTLISIAPSSEISLLDYIDEDEKESILVGMAKGTARFVTGEITRKNKDAFVVETPNATIGIRGTVATISVTDKLTTVLLTQTSGAGILITNNTNGEKINLTKPGNIVEIDGAKMEQREARLDEAGTLGAAVKNYKANTPPVELATISINPAGYNGANDTNNDQITLESQAIVINEYTPTPEPIINPVGYFYGSGTSDPVYVKFSVDGNANISNAGFAIREKADYFSIIADNGAGSIADGGAFDISGFSYTTVPAQVPPSVAEITGTFSSNNGGDFVVSTDVYGDIEDYSGTFSQNNFGSGYDIIYANGTFTGTLEDGRVLTLEGYANGNFYLHINGGAPDIVEVREGSLHVDNVPSNDPVENLNIYFTSENGGTFTYEDPNGGSHSGTFSK